jgi:hypothetical protein
MAEDAAPLTLFFTVARWAFVLSFLACLVLLVRRRRPGTVVLAAIMGSTYTWLITVWPLKRLWSLAAGHDRIFNLAMYATAATGHSPFESWQVGSPDLEPFWRALIGGASWGDPRRAMLILHYLPLVVLVALPLSFVVALRPRSDASLEEKTETGWELALIIFVVMCLSSSPLERFGVFQPFWLMMFVHKPNHAAAFALLPWLVRAVTRHEGWRSTAFTALLLSLLAWVFLIHWCYVAGGMAIYAVVAYWRGDRLRSRSAIVSLSLSLFAALPYFWFLLGNYGVTSGGDAAVTLWNKPGYEPGYYDVFTVSLEHGAVFLLSLVGVAGMLRRNRGDDRIWLALLAAGVPFWLLQFPLFALGRTGEPDELYYYVRFLLLIAAGEGAFFVLRAVSALVRPQGPARIEARDVALFLLVMLPLGYPYWWHPPTMDRYYAVGLEPLPAPLVRLNEWIRRRTSPDAVMLADSDTASWIAALSGRRAYLNRNRPPPDNLRRRELERALFVDPTNDVLRELHQHYRASHLVLDDRYLEELGIEPGSSTPAREFSLVYDRDGFRVYELPDIEEKR